MSKPSVPSKTGSFLVHLQQMHTLYTHKIKKQMEYMNQFNSLAPAALVESLLKMKALDVNLTFYYRFNQSSYWNGPCNCICTEIL